ncbi:hypothetical protein LTR10_023036 [Elasticomyces elasticus]|uniref:BZIP domain-containing protein n=1 Tax=Exophiala sideris TaxID=1016849 RepID=A0ABR0IWJ1_9EURO|nr:hypothetical protein LTR10_023036 [Elasticomyces elasticus]KAK5021042.1 hypothetical protein LTS07_011297 [Exophiala sideris]KAK5023317.1 hypothetical protein LTR13_011229 [Exophiala sideris]KAK5048768.1 hypothetical protein LTR69_011314 [Exophiala sideris]KAK5176168.1 hypothetical protein LTR44_011263 [Eurotiomycetes sp. CCFEE 6388]
MLMVVVPRSCYQISQPPLSPRSSCFVPAGPGHTFRPPPPSIALPSPQAQTIFTTRRGMSRRTGAQLERKRMQDRESQRNVRERTRKHIASLEQRLAELESATCVADLLKKNEELKEKVEVLEATLQTIVNIAARPSHTGDAFSVETEGHALLACNGQPREQRVDNNPASGDRRHPSLHGPPSPRGELAEKDTNAQQSSNLEAAGGRADGEGFDRRNENLLTPGSVDSGETEDIMVDFNDDFIQPSDLVPLAQSSALLSSLHYPGFDSLNKGKTAQDKRIPVSLDGFLTSSVNPTLTSTDELPVLNTFYLSPGPFWQSKPHEPQRQFPAPQNCPPSNIWDVKLMKCINEHRTHVGDTSMCIPKDPELRLLLNPNASRSTADSLTRFLHAPISQWNFKLPEKLAIFWLNYIHLRYRIFPTEESLDELPVWLHPCPSQCRVSHPIYIDALPWPVLREKLTFEHRLYPFNMFSPVFCSSLNVNWPYDHAMTYVREASGTLRLSRAFKTHLRKLENWSLRPTFALSYPELSLSVIIK